MGLVKISDLLGGGGGECTTPKISDFIEINVVANSGKVDKAFDARFIFSDEANSIHAVVNRNHVNSSTIINMLQVNTKWRICQFTLLASPRDTIILCDNTGFEMLEASMNGFPTHIPYHFTQIEEIQKLSIESYVDFIGVAKKVYDVVTSTGGCAWRKVRISSTCNPNESAPEFDVLLYGDNVNKISLEKQDCVFAFHEARVGKGCVSTWYAWTFIEEIQQSELHHRLPQYSAQRFVLKLFQRFSDGCPVSPLAHKFNLKQYRNGSHPFRSTRRVVEFDSSSIPLKIGRTEDFVTVSNVGEENRHPFINPCETNHGANDDASQSQTTYDFKDDKRLLKVSVKPSKTLMDKGVGAYEMNSMHRGCALIIQNVDFVNHAESRRGSEYDVDYLEKFFRSCYFKVVTYTNVVSTQLPQILSDFKGEFTKRVNMNGCVVALLSHGTSQTMELSDGKTINIYTEIFYRFSDTLFPAMKGRPKIFICQICQDFTTSGDTPTHRIGAPMRKQEYDLWDTIICFATLPGFKAHRDTIKGSYFIYVLIDVMMKKAHNTEFQKMLGMVRQRFIARIHAPEGERYFQLPFSVNHGFRKKLYFNPGIFASSP